ncbi:4'-phosphopantetheinyl transferase family protein [Streptomyces atratus]|uniref:4'-phosphopantetheinyl transferase family protein n=1 Tax=Streptomyces atratus TaxID=1893 RepID=UPI00225C278D|nr:4'-phosphopantetheinyl transferase superfamily protein [Streptomyces atratus]MCX5339007.1 4'-phosphopantetheinyl transferase superfamily protein [Streptomyces atratus]
MTAVPAPTSLDSTIAVRLWLVPAGGRDTPQEAPSVLDADERRRALAFHRACDRSRYIGAHTLLRRILGAHLGVAPREVLLTRERCPMCGGPHGRPAVANGAVHFSLAYSGELCLVAVASTPVGVDMERIPSPEQATRLGSALHPREASELLALPAQNRPLAFARAWVRKEAYLKGLGTGLTRGLSVDDVGTGPVPAQCSPDWLIADVALGRSRVAAIAIRRR